MKLEQRIDEIGKYAPDLLELYLMAEVKKHEFRKPSLFARIVEAIK